MSHSIHQRKTEHIQISLEEKVTGTTITTGFEKVGFVHNALPEIDFNEITIETSFLQHNCKTPFLISSMTGGAKFAGTINHHLAEAAEEKGWAFALGSTRAMIESEAYRSSFQLRKIAPTIPIIANLGAVQLNYGFGVDECKKIVEWTESNALVLHLNSIQEVIQPEGDVNFKGLLKKIEKLTSSLSVPVGVKEVGWGIDGQTAKQLTDVGISFIDVAGAGGTSWSQIEKYRTTEDVKRIAAEAFTEWGIPTVDCIQSVRSELPHVPIIASGGLKNGVEAAKAIALGADMVGFGRSILKEATASTEEVLKVMETRELELKIAMFGIGAESLRALKDTDRVTIS
ncbi:type 2 isopentenyl-diphosphate Delta-isomerase [Sporosarcina pasteurii]|uniref:Isopentenyl-diphosphate delta-isomerase n=1 Tax=Sporosarcina pasteurii TaxID=1474 RepID=A0A380BSW9_SPOPA|nr:type 2 isopentenyl-diphosphate Delta-isomerase [Sporosarcina pasteurii]MDS9471196.1 type 2 isopentenyl-diphosphate Delta-isomerase [Sporosarcina pasteurii]QBQ05167.1 type 2 isopentenyl-diphosphate Delta-isomerase [Sporosarcina pasteurii]SUJ05507.1 Isopentenyl-diphosphate delta-isomerase [Sporosarcina pasteurii]